MKIAILGATSHIAKDLILMFSVRTSHHLHLFARRPAEVTKWLANAGLSKVHPAGGFHDFPKHHFDVVINFVGIGDPEKAVAIGAAIFDITLRFDGMVLKYLRRYPACRYIFLSSGAAYGSDFKEPAKRDTRASLSINNLAPHEWYGAAKLLAECRHRAHFELPIVDVRVFNYFSRSQDLSARFLITDMLRAIRSKSELIVSQDYMVRDFMHPSDFFNLINAIISFYPVNDSVDCYSQSPIDKPTLLLTMKNEFGLQYKIASECEIINATGLKTYYYSTNVRADYFGYKPGLTSIEGILLETKAILGISTVSTGER